MSKSGLTVTPFDVDVDAHFDAAEGLCLGHGHLHRWRHTVVCSKLEVTNLNLTEILVWFSLFKTQHWWYHESQRFTIKWSLAKQRVKVCQNFQSPGTQSRQGMELGLHQVPGMDVSEKARSGFGLCPSTGWRRTSRSYNLFFHSWSVQSLFKSHFCKEFFQGCQNISWQLLKQKKNTALQMKRRGH